MITWNNELYHYGMPRRSGRYKYGSGERPYQHGPMIPRVSKETKDAARAASQNKKNAKESYRKSKAEYSKSYSKYKHNLERHPIRSTRDAHGKPPITKYGKKVDKRLRALQDDAQKKMDAMHDRKQEYKDAKKASQKATASMYKEKKDKIYDKLVEWDKKEQRKEMDRLHEKSNAYQKRNIKLTDSDKDMLKNTGNIKEILEYRDQFTDKELQQIYNRMNTEQNLSKIQSNRVKNGEQIYNSWKGARKRAGNISKNSKMAGDVAKYMAKKKAGK